MTKQTERRRDPEEDRPTLPPTLDPELVTFEETAHKSGEWHAVIAHVAKHMGGES
jgi:hypothetical protein